MSFALQTERALAQYEAEAVALVSAADKEVGELMRQARRLDEAASKMVAALDLQGKELAGTILYFLVLLVLGLSWVLLAAQLWGSSADLTVLIMPAIVLRLKAQADAAVTKVKQTAPKLRGAVEAVTASARSIAADGDLRLTQAKVAHMIEGGGLQPERALALKGLRTIGRRTRLAMAESDDEDDRDTAA